jgi:ATP sulfurylase
LELVDNNLSPHGGVLIDRVATPQEANEKICGRPSVAIRDQIVRECVHIAHGFLSPLEGFIVQADGHAVVSHMTLRACAEPYGFGSAFMADNYVKNRSP